MKKTVINTLLLVFNLFFVNNVIFSQSGENTYQKKVHEKSMKEYKKDYGSYNYKYTPKDGYVPTEETAIQIAEIIWLSRYGKDIYETKPFIATLIDNKFWVVIGSLPENRVGGVPYIEIRKKDAKILKSMHTK